MPSKSIAAIGFAALVSAFCAGGVARAQYPERPIQVVVPFPPGAADVYVRILQPKMSEFLGQPLVIVNRAGAKIGRAHV